MDKTHHLGDLQYAIMRVLWAEGEASAARVLEALPKKHRRAPTTIAWSCSASSSIGISSGRCWPSASIMTKTSPPAARMPALTAAPFPMV